MTSCPLSVQIVARVGQRKWKINLSINAVYFADAGSFAGNNIRNCIFILK